MKNHQPHFNINRRRFLKGATAAALLSSFGTYGLDLIYRDSPWRVGLIGAGWYGTMDLWRLLQVAPCEIVAICDVDRRHRETAALQAKARQPSGKMPRTYRDYRRMLDTHEFDIVLIGTPDHWHALTAIHAMERGANLYLQKPISVDVLEGEAILSTARKLGRKVQIGTQRRSTPHLVEAREKIVRQGLLGTIGHVEICCYYHMRANGNPPLQEVPEFLDYDLWTGPAPMRPYDGLPHKRWWRTFMEYGNGIMGDMCVHMLDAVRWMLDLGWPDQISSEGGILVQTEGKSNITDTQTAIFHYPDFKIHWTHRSWGTPEDPEYPWAFKIFGEKGTLAGDVMKYEFTSSQDDTIIRGDVLYEREKYPADLEEKDIELHAVPATRRHLLDLLTTIGTDKAPVASIEEGHISSASCILANLALEIGRPVAYDPIKHIIPGDTEASALLMRAYREGWEHPYGKS
ncbi:Gfo/Idh/MocA family protein [Robiginitalea myxolifaciens]|uniref:Gfo/Idh/MocA family protein n=1 Tax=Robiginitalea myxolifaciens TaxID=400055 RepID=UPI000B80E60C|nr:Gfo/Idh/MocA family oxidoreductase [Robiginitalea myxolifaciens]